MLYAVRCLKSSEDMILALAGQFKQLSHEPEKFRWLNGIRTHDLIAEVMGSNPVESPELGQVLVFVLERISALQSQVSSQCALP